MKPRRRVDVGKLSGAFMGAILLCHGHALGAEQTYGATHAGGTVSGIAEQGKLKLDLGKDSTLVLGHPQGAWETPFRSATPVQNGEWVRRMMTSEQVSLGPMTVPVSGKRKQGPFFAEDLSKGVVKLASGARFSMDTLVSSLAKDRGGKWVLNQAPGAPPRVGSKNRKWPLIVSGLAAIGVGAVLIATAPVTMETTTFSGVDPFSGVTVTGTETIEETNIAVVLAGIGLGTAGVVMLFLGL